MNPILDTLGPPGSKIGLSQVQIWHELGQVGWVPLVALIQIWSFYLFIFFFQIKFFRAWLLQYIDADEEHKLAAFEAVVWWFDLLAQLQTQIKLNIRMSSWSMLNALEIICPV